MSPSASAIALLLLLFSASADGRATVHHYRAETPEYRCTVIKTDTDNLACTERGIPKLLLKRNPEARQ